MCLSAWKSSTRPAWSSLVTHFGLRNGNERTGSVHNEPRKPTKVPNGTGLGSVGPLACSPGGPPGACRNFCALYIEFRHYISPAPKCHVNGTVVTLLVQLHAGHGPTICPLHVAVCGPLRCCPVCDGDWRMIGRMGIAGVEFWTWQFSASRLI